MARNPPPTLAIAMCAQASFPRIGPAKSRLQASSESAGNLAGGLRGRNRQAPIWPLTRPTDGGSREMAPAEFSVDSVAWICVPNEAHDFHEHIAASSKPGITCLQQRKGSTADVLVLRAQQSINMRSR